MSFGLLEGAQLGVGLYNQFAAAGARKRAEEARRKLIAQIGADLDRDYNDTVERNRQGLYMATGQGGDAIEALGRRLGSSLAEGGIYDSSAAAGALTQAKADEAQHISALANDQMNAARAMRAGNTRYLAGLKMGVANDDLARADGNYAGGATGLTSLLGQLTQNNLSRSGATTTRAAGPAMNGNQNGTLPSIWDGTPLKPVTAADRLGIHLPTLDIPTVYNENPNAMTLSGFKARPAAGYRPITLSGGF